MTLRSIACMLPLVAGLAPNLLGSHDPTLNDEYALRGLKSVYIVVSEPAIQDQVLRPLRPVITEAVESAVKKAGVDIVSQEQRRTLPTTPGLFVEVREYAERSQGRVVYHITATLRERMQLERDPSVLIPVSTWSATETAILIDDPETTILRVVDGMLKKFADAVRPADPKEQGDVRE